MHGSPLKSNLHELLWLSPCSLVSTSISPEKLLGEAWGLLSTDRLNLEQSRMSHGALQTSRIGPADTDSPVIYSIHHHVYEHINQNYGNRLRFIKFTFLFSVMFFFFWHKWNNGGSCHTMTTRISKLTKSQRGPNPQWRHNNWKGQVGGAVPLKFLPPVGTSTVKMHQGF